MAISSRTIVLNAAFLQEIKEDDVMLRQLLQQVRVRFSEGRWLDHPARDTWQLLEQLRDQLATHFTLEEACGYLETSLEEAPELSCKAAQLRNEHGPLFLQICEICELCAQGIHTRSGRRWLGRVAMRFWQFDVRFRKHEQQEEALILEAFHQDTGVGD